jgi:heat shock protein HtpX
LARALQRLESAAKQLPMAGNPAFEPLLIVNAFSGSQFLSSLFSSHPSTQARIEQLLKLEQELPKTSSEFSFTDKFQQT